MGNNIWRDKQINYTHKRRFCESDLQYRETQSSISKVMRILTPAMSDTPCSDILTASSSPARGVSY